MKKIYVALLISFLINLLEIGLFALCLIGIIYCLKNILDLGLWGGRFISVDEERAALAASRAHLRERSKCKYG